MTSLPSDLQPVRDFASGPRRGGWRGNTLLSLGWRGKRPLHFGGWRGLRCEAKLPLSLSNQAHRNYKKSRAGLVCDRPYTMCPDLHGATYIIALYHHYIFAYVACSWVSWVAKGKHQEFRGGMPYETRLFAFGPDTTLGARPISRPSIFWASQSCELSNWTLRRRGS